MQKIDYGDINKFLVSIGTVLIGLAILAPLLYLKEDFGLFIEQNKFDKLQEPIQNLLTDRQEKIIIIQKFLPLTSLVLLVLGLISSIVGLFRWFKRQSKIDEKFDKEIQKLDLEIETLSPEEKEEKAKKETQEIEMEEQVQTPTTTTTTTAAPSSSQSVINYMRIESEIIEVFKNYKSENFDILPQQRLGNRFEIDILLKAKNNKYSDRVVEIKYFNNQLPISIIRKTLDRQNTLISYYKTRANKQVIPVLLVVYKKEKFASDKIVDYQNKIMDYAQDIPNLSRLKIQFIEESEIDNFKVQRLLKK